MDSRVERRPTEEGEEGGCTPVEGGGPGKPTNSASARIPSNTATSIAAAGRNIRMLRSSEAAASASAAAAAAPAARHSPAGADIRPLHSQPCLTHFIGSTALARKSF